MAGRWTEERIRRELEAFLPGWEVWPSYPVFRASGWRGLWQAMLERGGPERFAEEYGLPYRRNDRALSDAEIRVRLRAGCGVPTSSCGRRARGCGGAPARSW